MNSLDRDEESRGALLRGVLLLCVVGSVIGLAHNAVALRAGNETAVAWIGEDRVAELAELDAVRAAPGSVATASVAISDDPLAPPPGASTGANAGLPPIPDIGRPVPIDAEALRMYVEAGAVMVIDAREEIDYREGRIPGAISLPYDEAITDPVRLEDLDPEGRPIVVYCGGGTCEVSLELAYELIGYGHGPLAVYMGGYPEWEQAGYPIEREPATRTGG